MKWNPNAAPPVMYVGIPVYISYETDAHGAHV